MSGLKQKPNLNRLILALAIFSFSGCGSFLTRQPERPDTPVDQFSEFIRQYKSCNGSGWVSWAGEQNGRMGFNFTCSRDSVWYQFKDILGRRVLYLESDGGSFLAWDQLNQVVYSDSSLPVSELLVRALDTLPLLSLSWGITPKNAKRGGTALIDVSYTESDVGLVVEKVVLKIEKPNQEVIIKFTVRNWGTADRKIIRTIPDSIPVTNLNGNKL